MKLSIGEKINAVFGAALLILLAIGWISYRTVTDSIETAHWVTHTHAVLRHLEEMFSRLKDVETGQWSYLITGKERYLDANRTASEEIHQRVRQLQELTTDNVRQQKRLDALAPLIAEQLNATKELVDLRQQKGFTAAWQAAHGDEGENLMVAIRRAVYEMADEEKRLLTQREIRAQESAQRSIGIIIFGNVVGFIFVALAGVIIGRDLSARKRRAEALQESEERYRSLVETAKDVIFTISADGTFVSLNSAFETVTDWSRAEWIGKSFAPLVHPDDIPLALELVQCLLRGEIPLLSELRIRLKSGATRVWELTAAPQSRRGAVVGVLVIARDVTERQQAENALQESEERFRLLSASSPIGIFSNNITGACLYTNPRWQEIAGLTLEESLGHGWLNAITPEDRESVVIEWQACAREEREFSGEFRFVQPGGEVRWVRTRAVGLRSDSGALLGYVGTAEDITEHRQARLDLEQLRHQLELILTSVADGIYVMDRQGKTTFMNPAAARMVGYRTEELLGRPMHELVHHSKPNGTPYPPEECQIYAALTDGAIHHVINEVFWRRDGSSFPVEYLSAPIREHGGEIVGAAVTFRDVSEQRAVEKMKDEFVSVVSHELRTPLTSIRGALGLLTSGLVGELPKKGQRMVEIAANNTDRLVRLINDILDIERMQSGKVTIQRRVCDAATLLAQATDEMRAMADKARVLLSVSPQAARLWADPDRIIQTLTNLLSNAIKFSSEGSTVWLTVTRQGQDVRFAVIDQGPGIPGDKLESIFERFQQVNASDSRKEGGTGLGLAICRSIIQQHDGRIWVESTLGQGSIFYFTLPALEETEQADTDLALDSRP